MVSSPDSSIQQQVSWILRKAYARASIKLDISQYIATQSSESVVMIDIVQTASGWASTRESRSMSGILQNHNDYIFGSVETRSCLMYGSGDASTPIAGLEPESHIEKVKGFLQGQILQDGSTSAGFLVEEYNGDHLGAGKGLWVYTISHNSAVGWTAEQVGLLLLSCTPIADSLSRPGDLKLLMAIDITLAELLFGKKMEGLS